MIPLHSTSLFSYLPFSVLWLWDHLRQEWHTPPLPQTDDSKMFLLLKCVYLMVLNSVFSEACDVNNL